eukprot:CAMPEP_0172647214 /NCGR_PEP_ID=MMETSP1068-20121228/240638_1 /TAXON_ID=35684 /ORGANISM="Pseudopedinella elastica, Strain CCMP716" /LENGTH=603 /DNA_ID=CAMNT_0013461487 /DNA_START=226 /DNA_END=2038 /DNA_ORIENTATION=-
MVLVSKKGGLVRKYTQKKALSDEKKGALEEAYASFKVPVKNELTSTEATLWLIFLYYWFGSVIYTVGMEEWATVDALYFLTSTMTTVGDARHEPTSQGSRVVTLFWAVAGVGLVAAGLIELFEVIAEARDRLYRRTKQLLLKLALVGKGEMSEGEAKEVAAIAQRQAQAKKRRSTRVQRLSRVRLSGMRLSSGERLSGVLEGVLEETKDGEPAGQEGALENNLKKASATSIEAEAASSPVHPMQSDSAKALLRIAAASAMFYSATGCLLALVEGWPLGDGIYYAVIVSSTIGLGDVTPETDLGKVLGVLFIPAAVVFASVQFTSFAHAVREVSLILEDDPLEELLAKDLSLEGLLAMDEDGDGEITEYEFIRFMLVSADPGGAAAMDEDGDGEITEYEFIRFMLVSADLADAGVLDALHQRFAELDTDGSGALTADDLRLEPLGMPQPERGTLSSAVEGAVESWAAAVAALPPSELAIARSSTALLADTSSAAPGPAAAASLRPSDKGHGRSRISRESSGAPSREARPVASGGREANQAPSQAPSPGGQGYSPGGEVKRPGGTKSSKKAASATGREARSIPRKKPLRGQASRDAAPQTNIELI